MAALLDMSQIPLPAAVEELSFDAIVAASKARYVELMQVDDPTYELRDTDPAARALEVWAFREMLLRARINDSVRGTLLASATGGQLDDLGADPAYGPTARLLVTPEQLGPPYVAPVMESDDAYRARLKLAPHQTSVAGPSGAYESRARGANGAIIDVAVTSPQPGYVLVEVLHDGVWEDVRFDIFQALLSDDVRPVGDVVTVIEAAHVTSSIALTVYVDEGPDLELVQTAAQERINNLVLPKCARVKSGPTLSLGEEYSFLGACVVDGVSSYDVTGTTGLSSGDVAWWPMTITVTAMRVTTDDDEPPGIVPFEMDSIGGAQFLLVKNWEFGTGGNIGSIAALDAEFDYANLWGTYNLGGEYGTNTVATSAETAVSGQPVDPTGSKFREFTANSIKCHVKAFTDGDDVGPASELNGGNGSFFSKFRYPAGGSDLGKTIVWETKFKIDNPTAGQWFALWTAGTNWDQGPEMDVIEAFSAYQEYVNEAWHSNLVGDGTEDIDYWSGSWWDGQEQAGVFSPDNQLQNEHVITWVYHVDNSFQVYFDGFVIQSGAFHWRVGDGDHEGEITDMQFLFDMGALHSVVGDYVSYVIAAADLPITYEIFYSRIFERSS
jgi:phage-related baseplate assembly protein